MLPFVNHSCYQCDECSRSFSSPEALEQHKNATTADHATPFECQTCDKTFYNLVDANRHKIKKCYGNGPFWCNPCAREFSSGDGLDNHTKAKHGASVDVSSVVDSLSGLSFGNASDAECASPHIFKCGRCESGFRSKQLRAHHSMIIHEFDSELYHLKASDLSLFVASELQPTSSYSTSCRKAVDRLVHFLQNNIPGELRPKEVIKGGSLGKGTALDERLDIGLVIFLAGYKRIADLKRDMGDILKKLKQYLDTYGACAVTEVTQHAVKVKLSGADDCTHDVDILPSINLLAQCEERAIVYEEIKTQDASSQSCYSAALVPLQVEFIKRRCPKLKDIIRIVKYWRKSCLRENHLGERRIPSSYTFELICTHVWEKKSGALDFDLRRMLYLVMSAICNYRTLKVEWFEYYNQSSRQTSTKPYYVVDPANPFNNVMADCNVWSEAADKAKEFLRQPLFDGF